MKNINSLGGGWQSSYMAIKYDYEPLLLVPIGTGELIGNIPFVLDAGLQVGIYESGSVLNYLYFGVLKGIYPPLIFLGIGAMTDPAFATFWVPGMRVS